MKLGFSLLSICLFVLTLPGCGGRSSEQESLVQMAVKLEKNSTSIKELSLGLDGVNARLATMESSLLKLASASSPSGLARAPAGGSADMESLYRQVTVLMEELSATNEELESAKRAMEKIAAKASEPKDIGRAFYNVARDPQTSVESFFDATKGKDLDGILACFAPDVREVFEEMMEIQGREKMEEQLAGGDKKIGDLKILDTNIEGDWATVKTSVMVDGKKEESDVQVHKIDGAWYIDMPEEEKKGMKEALKMMEEMERNMPKPEGE